MKVVICPNCGANDFKIINGYKVCNYCGSKYSVESMDLPAKKTIIAIEDDIQMLLEKCRLEPYRAKKYANLILDIDPDNEEARKYL